MVRRPYSDYPPAKQDNDSDYKIDDHGVLEKFYENSSDHPIDENQPIIVSEGSYDSPVVEEVYDLDSEYDHRKAESSDWDDRFKVQITDSPPSSAILISPTEEDVPQRRNNSLPFRRRGGNKENYGTASATNSDYNADNHFIGNFDDGSEDITEKSTSSKSNHSTWNKLNATLFFGHALLSAATSVPVTLVPTMARSLEGISKMTGQPIRHITQVPAMLLLTTVTPQRLLLWKCTTRVERGSDGFPFGFVPKIMTIMATPIKSRIHHHRLPLIWQP